uniref:Thrombospondin-like N-terminal domain-containing protein n=1 Tax=Erpetoichthys calabaricus TaxID=27687 RepID=A0A8C4T611_ERPCA
MGLNEIDTNASFPAFCSPYKWLIFIYLYFFLFTGFDLTEKFLLRKAMDSALVFPNGLSDEYSLVSTFRLRRTTKKDRWYLWQIADQNGSPQISIVIDGNKRVVELAVRGLLKNTLYYTFKSRDLHTLFDRQWHKLSFSFQSKIVSLYMDCKLIERRLIDEKDAIDSAGRMLITTRVEDGRPIDVSPGYSYISLVCDTLTCSPFPSPHLIDELHPSPPDSCSLL